MRRKNGYTLTEILVVVLLLTIVGGIIIFNVNVVLNNNKSKSYEKFVTTVKSSAETYANLNLNAINDLYDDKSFTYVTVGELIDQGFLDEKLTNPYTGERIKRDEIVKLSLSSETGNLTITYPVDESNKEVFLSSTVLTVTTGESVDCMEGIGSYTLALSDESGKLILDKNTLINNYNFSCKLPDSFTKTTTNDRKEIGSTDKVGTYEIEYTWISLSGTKGRGKRFLKVVPETIKLLYNVEVLEGHEVDAWTNSTCMGKIDSEGNCYKDILVGYNYGDLSRPIRTGYTFAGWYDEVQENAESSGNGNKIISTTKVLNKNDHIIYAQWERGKYGVTLNSELNGRPATYLGTTSLEAKYNLPLNQIDKPKREFDIIFNKNDVSEENGTTTATVDESSLVARWDFEGYYDSSNIQYIDSTGIGNKAWDKTDENTILYAKWTNGRITLPNASRPGYTFDGWFTGKTNGDERDNNYQYEMPDTLYAHWSPKTYHVYLNYNDNDGGSTHANETTTQIDVVFDKQFDNLFMPSRNGYTFLGWFTEDEKEITKTTYATNEYKIIENDGLQLYARWKKNDYYLTLDVNKPHDMTNTPTVDGENPLIVTFDTNANNTVNVPSMTGWTFEGWYVGNVRVFNANGHYNEEINTYFDLDGEWIYTDSVTVYAKWIQNTYTITLDLNKNDKMTYEPKISDNHSNTYEMTYDSTNNNEIAIGELDGWKFLGWYDSENHQVFDENGKYVISVGTNYFNNGKWFNDSDITVYARWEQKSYIVTLDINNPDANQDPIIDTNIYTLIYDDEVSDIINIPSQINGYEFDGWYADDIKVFNADGSINDEATGYFINNKWIKSDNVLLKAKWNTNGYVITLDNQNATNEGTQLVYIDYNQTLTNIDIPKKEYHVTLNTLDENGSTKVNDEIEDLIIAWQFNGYFSETEGNGNSYYNELGHSSLLWTETANRTLYAYWTGGELTGLIEPVRDGYTFGGWYLEDTFENVITNGYVINEDIELYAKWTKNNYVITLNTNKLDEMNEDPTIDQNTITVEFDSVVNTPISVPYIRTWSFLGWYDSEDNKVFDEQGNVYLTSNNYIDSNNNWVLNDDIELKAKWEAKTHYLNLDITSIPDKMISNPIINNNRYSMEIDTNTNNTVNIPSEVDGWNFLGWYDLEDNKVFDEQGNAILNNDYWNASGEWIYDGDLTLIGKWEGKTYNITFDYDNFYENETSTVKYGDLLDNKVVENIIHTVTFDFNFEMDNTEDRVVTKEAEWIFDGFYSSDNVQYINELGEPIKSFDLTEDTTLYAKFTNGKVEFPTIDRPDYVLIGWKNTSGEFINNSYQFREDMNLFAHWGYSTYVIELDINKPESMEEEPIIDNSIYQLSLGSTANNNVNVPEEITGWKFLGWYDSEDRLVYKADGSYNNELSIYFDELGKWKYEDNQNTSLKGKWEVSQSIISLFTNKLDEMNDPELNTNTYYTSYDNSDVQNIDVPVPEFGYIFEGWYDLEGNKIFDENGNVILQDNPYFSSTGRWKHIDNLELYAHWIVLNNVLDLNIVSIDGLEIPSLENKMYQMELNTSNNNTVNIPVLPIRYMFEGWYDLEDNQVFDNTGKYVPNTRYFDSEGNWLLEENVRLYSKIERRKSIITLDTNKQEEMEEDPFITNNVYIIEYLSNEGLNVNIPNTMFAWVFEGWYDSEDNQVFDSSGNRILKNNYFDSEGNWIYTENLRLKAHWNHLNNILQLNVIPIEEYEEQPTIVKSEYQMELNQTTNNIVNIPAIPTAYIFEGWYDSEDNQVFDNTGKYVPNTRYFDSEGNWLLEENIRLYSKIRERKTLVSLIYEKEEDMDDTPVVEINNYLFTYGKNENNIINIPNEIEQYKFLGWYDGDNQVFDDLGNKILDNEYFDSEGNLIYVGDTLVLKAKWNHLDIVITLDMNKPEDFVGDPTITTMLYTMEKNTTTNNKINVPTYDEVNYTFAGWYYEDIQVYDTGGNCNTSATSFFDEESKWIRKTSVTLKAKWIQIDKEFYIVTLDVNKSDDMNNEPVVERNSYPLIIKESKNNIINIPTGNDEGYIFEGWYDEDNQVFDETGKFVSNTDYFDSEGNWIKHSALTLKAKWIRNVTNELVNDSSLIVSRYMNKFTNNYFIVPKDNHNADKFDFDSFYTSVGTFNEENVPETISINGDTYTSTNNRGLGYYMSIGNNAWILAPVYEVKNGILYVATPWLIAESINEDSINITLGSKTYNIITNDSSTSTLKITSVVTLWTKDGYINTVEYDSETNTYTNYTNNGTQGIGAIISTSNDGITYTPITNPNTVIYRLSPNGSMGFSSPEQGVTYALYPLGWKNGIFTDITLNTNSSVKLAIPGYGSVNFKYHALVPTSKVVFDTDGGNVIDDITIVTGNTITLPTPIKEHYIFEKWVLSSDDSTEFTESTKVTEDIIIKAKWTHGSYGLNLDVNKPEDMEADILLSNNSYEMNLESIDNNEVAIPEKITGWKFLGWYDSEDRLVYKADGSYNNELSIYFDELGKWKYELSDEITLKAKWEQSTSLLSLIADTLEEMADTTLELNTYVMLYDNNSMTSIAIPTTEEDYTFLGWYDSEDNMIFDSTGTLVLNNNPYYSETGRWKSLDNLILYAKWNKNGTEPEISEPKLNELELVINVLDDMTEIPTISIDKYTMEKNSDINNIVNIPTTVTGYIFKGWYNENEQVFDETGKYVESTYFDSEGKWLKEDGARLISKFEPIMTVLTLDINKPEDMSNEPTITTTEYNMVYNTNTNSTINIPTSLDANYTFAGWYDSDNNKIFDETGASIVSSYFNENGKWISVENVTLIAHWNKNNN